MASKPKWVEALNDFAIAQYRQEHADVRYALRTRVVAEVQKLAGIDENGDLVCDHKFIGSMECRKCGWAPVPSGMPRFP